MHYLSKAQNFNDSYFSCYDTETQYFFYLTIQYFVSDVVSSQPKVHLKCIT